MSFRRVRSVLNVALGFLLALSARSVVAAGPDRFFSSGRLAQAGWFQADGCRQTQFEVVYVESTVRETPGTPPVDSPLTLFFGMTVSDFCTGTFVDSGGDGQGQLTILGALNEARLQGTVTGQVVQTGQPIEVSVDLTFTATGEMVRQFQLFISSVGNMQRIRSRARGQMREAVATGSVKVNGLEILPGPSTQGTLSTGSSVEFTRGF